MPRNTRSRGLLKYHNHSDIKKVEQELKLDNKAHANLRFFLPNEDEEADESSLCNYENNVGIFVCPVCEREVPPLLTIDLSKRLFDEDGSYMRALRIHCDAFHETEYIWNVCRVKGSKLGTSVSSTISYVFQKAAETVPLPQNLAFVDNWECVALSMVKRLAAALFFTRNSYQNKPVLSKDVKTLAIRHIKDLCEVVLLSSALDRFSTWRIPPHLWQQYSQARRRNLIELFFWGGSHRDFGLITNLSPLEAEEASLGTDGNDKPSNSGVEVTKSGDSEGAVESVFASYEVLENANGNKTKCATCPVCCNMLPLNHNTDFDVPFSSEGKRKTERLLADHYERFGHADEPLWNTFLKKMDFSPLGSVEWWIKHTLKAAADAIEIRPRLLGCWNDVRNFLLLRLSFALTMAAMDTTKLLKSKKIPERDLEEHSPAWRVWIKDETQLYLQKLSKIVSEADARPGFAKLPIPRLKNLIQLFFVQEDGHRTCKLIDPKLLPPVPQFALWAKRQRLLPVAPIIEMKKGRKKRSLSSQTKIRVDDRKPKVRKSHCGRNTARNERSVAKAHCERSRMREGNSAALAGAVRLETDDTESVEDADAESGHFISAVLLGNVSAVNDPIGVRNVSKDSSAPFVEADKELQHTSTFVEDTAWKYYPVDKMCGLSPPGQLPALPNATEEQSCFWELDSVNRILKVSLNPGCDKLSDVAKAYLLSMMERDDIAVITAGLSRDFSSYFCSLSYIAAKVGTMFHHRFRKFVRMNVEETADGGRNPQSQYEEINPDFSMRVGDFVKYLEARNASKLGAARQRTGVDLDDVVDMLDDGSSNKLPTVVDLDDVVYMLDYDISKKLPELDTEIKQRFLFPEILPGGGMCAMHAVNANARPDMGPNLFVTPPGSFTRFHQDGYGTVDSGHLCLSGYNEVVMLRRLPSGHEENAIQADAKCFFEMPHADLVHKKTSDWPTKTDIDRMKSMNYCPIVLLLGPGEHLHIGKGRFHAFRKLGAEMLPDDDCHSDLRKEVHSSLAMGNRSPDTLLNISIAWDWSFLGYTAEGINREMTYSLERALLNRKGSPPKPSLAIPRLCLLSWCKASIGKFQSSDLNPDDLQRDRNILMGLLPSLEFVVAEELQVFRVWNESHPQTETHDIPLSSENPNVCSMDPHDYSDYTCKICLQELPNHFLHCNGCEALLEKDFNVCVECHAGSRHRQFYIMSDTNDSMDSHFNHTGARSTVNHEPCAKKKCRAKKEACRVCGKDRTSSCTCHECFKLIQRMWSCKELSEMLAAVKDIVGGDRLLYHDEVLPRLQKAGLRT